MGLQLKSLGKKSKAHDALQNKGDEQSRDRLHEAEFRDLELQAANAKKEQARAQNELDHKKSRQFRERELAFKTARDNKKIEFYNRYKTAYEANLRSEGFELSDSVWTRIFLDSDGIKHEVRFRQLPVVSLATQIPSCLANGSEPKHVYASRRELLFKWCWYMKRNANYLRLGFVKSDEVKKKRMWFDGVFAFNTERFADQIWTWPGARSLEHLPQVIFPSFGPSTYQDKSLFDLDELVLHGLRWKPSRLDRLPSAHIGNWRDHLDRQMRAVKKDVIETYISAPKRCSTETHHEKGLFPLPLRSPVPRVQHSWPQSPSFTRLKSLASPWQHCEQPRPMDIIWKNDYRSRRPFFLDGRGCYDRKILRMILESADWVLRLARRRISWLSLYQRCSFWSSKTLPKAVPKLSSPRLHTIFEVPGRLGGRDVAAFPDSGSAHNILSKQYVLSQGISEKTLETTIKLPNGAEAITTGIVNLPWKFKDAPGQVHHVEFLVLEKCAHDILFGNPFLEQHKLNTENDYRITKRQVSKPLSSNKDLVYDCHLAGNITSRMQGTLNGKPTNIIPDSGCQVNALSLSTAMALGYDIKYSGERGTFRFIDGSTAPSLGVVKAFWKPDHSKEGYELEFEIMEDCEGIILGQKFLYRNRAFVKHAACMRSGEDINMDDDFNWNEKGTDNNEKYAEFGKVKHESIRIEILDPDGIDDINKGRVFEITYTESPWRRLVRRVRGKPSQRLGATTNISDKVLDEIERRAVAGFENERVLDDGGGGEIIREGLLSSRCGVGEGGESEVTLGSGGRVGDADMDGDGNSNGNGEAGSIGSSERTIAVSGGSVSS